MAQLTKYLDTLRIADDISTPLAMDVYNLSTSNGYDEPPNEAELPMVGLLVASPIHTAPWALGLSSVYLRRLSKSFCRAQFLETVKPDTFPGAPPIGKFMMTR